MESLTCKNYFEEYIALMDHRADKYPSNKPCNEIPECDGWVNEKNMPVCPPRPHIQPECTHSKAGKLH